MYAENRIYEAKDITILTTKLIQTPKTNSNACMLCGVKGSRGGSEDAVTGN